jgi:hypothetical protein
MTSTGGPSAALRLATRRSLHAVAEQLMAGHQFRVLGTIRLTVRPDGFTTQPMPGTPSRLAVDRTDLLVDDRRIPLTGRLGDLAVAAGVECRGPVGVYPLTADLGPEDSLVVHPAAADELHGSWVLGDSVLRGFAGAHVSGGAEPVLWPEHLDVAITLDEVNYGVSPGDSAIEQPYAYVGPHRPRAGAFWNQPFGAALILEGVSAPSLRAFFDEGRTRAATDPRAD